MQRASERHFKEVNARQSVTRSRTNGADAPLHFHSRVAVSAEPVIPQMSGMPMVVLPHDDRSINRARLTGTVAGRCHAQPLELLSVEAVTSKVNAR